MEYKPLTKSFRAKRTDKNERWSYYEDDIKSAIALLKLCLTKEYCCDQEHGCHKCGDCPEYLFELYEHGEDNQYCIKCIIDKIFAINEGD